jgi:hypothetical protein
MGSWTPALGDIDAGWARVGGSVPPPDQAYAGSGNEKSGPRAAPRHSHRLADRPGRRESGLNLAPADVRGKRAPSPPPTGGARHIPPVRMVKHRSSAKIAQVSHTLGPLDPPPWDATLAKRLLLVFLKRHLQYLLQASLHGLRFVDVGRTPQLYLSPRRGSDEAVLPHLSHTFGSRWSEVDTPPVDTGPSNACQR